METQRFGVLATYLSDEVWDRIGSDIQEVEADFPETFISIMQGLWLVDRFHAEEALQRVTGQLRAYGVPYALVPVTAPPAIHAMAEVLAKIRATGCPAYPIVISERFA